MGNHASHSAMNKRLIIFKNLTMSDIKKRELKMQERRKQTSFRDFLKEIVSRRALPFYRVNNLISRYPESDRIHGVVSINKFLEDQDALCKFWLTYGGNFFKDFQSLLKSISFGNVVLLSGCENSEYADQALNSKNAYLSYIIANAENILYSVAIKDGSTNIVNSINVVSSDNVYQSFNIVSSYNVFYSKQINNSSNMRFCTNMIWCHDCLLCDNLENQSYCIHNKQFKKEEFLQIKETILNKKAEYFDMFLTLTTMTIPFVSKHVDGDYIIDSENVDKWYYIQSTHDSKNVMLISWWNGCNHLYDTFAATWLPWWENYYGIMWCGWWNNVYNSAIIPLCNNTYYSYSLENCSYCLGCVGLRNKSFCILNKEYSKEERFELADKIFEKMDGEWIRRDEEIKVDVPEWAEVVEVKDLKNYQWLEKDKRTINPEILKKVIKDEKGNYYRIVKMEYDFLMKYWLPLPELHWLERIKLWFKFK